MAELAALKAKLVELKAKVLKLKTLDNKLEKDLGECPKGSDKKWCKKLTDNEAKCFWINEPKQALDFSK